MCPEWHTYENGLCFFRYSSTERLCNKQAVKEITDSWGNGHGIYCREHYPIKVKEFLNLGVLP